MHVLILMLLSAVGARKAVSQQTLMCPYELNHEGLQRVWCRQSSADCCTGFTFNESAHFLDGGKLEVTHGLDSFTVAVLKPSHGGGVYWCGVLSNNGTIIKLAEHDIHTAWGFYIWSIARWVLLPVMPMVVIFTNFYSRRIRPNMRKETDRL
ncbi:uncharacterized protein si:ch211-102c2.4 [Cheilinus undulatus]|uniref:uncharacterized protein si:ch211-102c2.4 n=1 Tax=Cheilinus undulatus TaxID=241271 RepID=UPI001BD21337|nr:uncharacterized protein si:ch211-102c2.4 [Cheilinus undulatus]